jgi:hypothetical protein
MEDNNQTIEQTVSEQNDTIRFISDEEVAQAMSQPEPAEVAPEPQPEPEQPTQEAVAEPQVEEQQQEEIIDEPQPDQQQAQQEYAPEQIEGAVFEFLSERLGRNINSFDDLTTQQQEQRELDERIAAIAEFVENTGRDPRDWFVYQSMNPSEMDDLTAIQVQMASDYPNLSQDEISTLISSKYKLDPDLYSEDEVKLSQLQMKIDSTAARKGIEEMRLQYQAPERKEAEPEQTSLIDDDWVSGMRQELDAMEGIEFNLGNDKTFTFGMDNNYKNQLAEKNARLDEFFDPYVREDGSWDYDMLNMHRAVIDNVESIVQSVYRQGMADGQRGIVQNAANATPTSPNQVNAQPASDPLAQQLRQILNISK